MAENIKISINIYGYDVDFEIHFAGTGGKFELISEKIEIKNILLIERKGKWLTIKHDEQYLDSVLNYKQLQKILIENAKIKRQLTKEDILQQHIRLKEIFPLIPLPFTSIIELEEKGYYVYILHHPYLEPSPAVIVSPFNVLMELWWYTHYKYGISILRRLDIQKIKKPVLPKHEYIIQENGENMSSVFHTVFLDKGGVPERIRSVICAVFGNDISLRPELTTDGRVFIKVFEGDLELLPPMIPDGLYKVLAILLALESKPRLLVIDELENSLHPLALEYIIHELKEADCTVIATTHSPAVVDLVDPEDLILVEKNEEGASVFRRVENPEEIKEQLSKAGITLSERWLYGKM